MLATRQIPAGRNHRAMSHLAGDENDPSSLNETATPRFAQDKPRSPQTALLRWDGNMWLGRELERWPTLPRDQTRAPALQNRGGAPAMMGEEKTCPREPPQWGGMSRGRTSPPFGTLRSDSVFHRSVVTALKVIW